MARHVPDEAGEFAGDSDADFVLCQLSSHREIAPALGQTQLRLPGDVADDLRLPLLTNLETKRFRTLLEQLSDGTGVIPKACQDWANIRCAYRSVSNQRVMTEISRGLSTLCNLSPLNAHAG